MANSMWRNGVQFSVEGGSREMYGKTQPRETIFEGEVIVQLR